jgi:hypothetical protein
MTRLGGTSGIWRAVDADNVVSRLFQRLTFNDGNENRLSKIPNPLSKQVLCKRLSVGDNHSIPHRDSIGRT